MTTLLQAAHFCKEPYSLHALLRVRAARNLPIMLLVREYEHILKRRLRVVGGSPDDPALQQMLDTFR